MARRLPFTTRTLGAVYLVVGAGAGVGAVTGGGAVAATWGVTCGAMGLAWLARTDAAVGADRIRLPRRGLRRRDVPFTDVARVVTPTRWALDPVAHAELHDGRRIPLRGLAASDLDALAAAARVPVVADAHPRSAPTP